MVILHEIGWNFHHRSPQSRLAETPQYLFRDEIFRPGRLAGSLHIETRGQN
jgi:hypothetical protein